MANSSKSAAVAQEQTFDPTPFVRGLQVVVPQEIVQQILTDTRRHEKRQRRLPASSVLWLVVAMTLLSELSIPQTFRALHPSEKEPEPDESAFTKARQRLGVRPLRRLYQQLACQLAPKEMPGVCYRRWRLFGLDGTTLNLADTPDNVKVFGKQHNDRSDYAYPQLRVLALCELGVHQVHDFAFRPIDFSEQSMVPLLLPRLKPGMLLLWDRNFFGYQRLRELLATGCDLLARVKAGQLIFKRDQELSDDSYLSKVYANWQDREADRGGILVRIIEYRHDDPARPGHGQLNRLLTSILDPREMPALDAPLVYHERWEIELVFDEIKTHLQGREVLRSKTPRGVVQELYGMMMAHRVLRQVMRDAAVATGVDADRLSFVNSLRILERHLPEATSRDPLEWYVRLLAEVSRQRLRPRRERWYPRVVKRKMKPWDKKRPCHLRPPQPTKPFAEAIVIT